MIKGHLDQTRSNLRSTKPKPLSELDPEDDSSPENGKRKEEEEEDEDEMSPAATEPPALKTQYVYAKCETTTGKIFTDQTGRFLTTSTSGNIDMLSSSSSISNNSYAFCANRNAAAADNNSATPPTHFADDFSWGI